MKLKARNLMVAAIAAASFSGMAQAGESWASSNVKTVYPVSNGNFVITFVDSPPGCTNANNPKYLYVAVGHNGVTADGVKAMLSTALAAFLSGKRIQAAFEDSTSECYINRLLIID